MLSFTQAYFVTEQYIKETGHTDELKKFEQFLTHAQINHCNGSVAWRVFAE